MQHRRLVSVNNLRIAKEFINNNLIHSRQRMLICLDFDGVIADTLDQHLKLSRDAQRQLGIGRPPTRQDFQEIISLTYLGWARQLGFADSEVPAWEATLKKLISEEDEKVVVFPRMPHVVRVLSRDHALCVITSNTRNVVARLLETHEMGSCVSRILDGDQPGSKAEKLRRMAAFFQMPLEKTFMVGDTRSDMKSGRDAGVQTVAVGWGFQSKDVLDKERPDFFVDQPEDLLRIFSKGELSI